MTYKIKYTSKNEKTIIEEINTSELTEVTIEEHIKAKELRLEKATDIEWKGDTIK